MNYPASMIPVELRALPQWVGWKFKEKGDGKKSKVPVRIRDKQPAAVNNHKDWTTFENALERLKKSSALDGIGFVFTEADDFCGIDIDHCRNLQTGELSPIAQEVVEKISSYTEISPSGTGIKIFLRSSELKSGRRTSEIELYCKARFFTVTGHVFQNYNQIHDRTEALNELWSERFGSDDISEFSGIPTQSEDWSHILSMLNVPGDDEVILNKAMTAPNGVKFIRLWNGLTTDHNNDHSRCDGSLCARLAYWCGPDPMRIDRLFRRSALMRPKWDEKHFSTGQTYGEWQIANVIELQQKGRGFFHWNPDCKQPKQKTLHASSSKETVQTQKPKSTKNLSMDIDAKVFFHAKAQSMKQQMKWRDFVQNLLANC